MSRYEIVRWNVVTDCNGIQRPMVYFKPDTSMILQLQNNNNYLYLNIDQYGLYAGTMIPALVDISSQQPNYRPNFFEACHLFCATLIETPWYGFPNLLESGSFSVYDGVIIPSCWRNNDKSIQHAPNDPNDPQRHSGDPQRHSGDQQQPQRHSGDQQQPQRHSGDIEQSDSSKQPASQKKTTSSNLEESVLPGVPLHEPKVDYSASPMNYAPITVTPQEREVAEAVLAAENVKPAASDYHTAIEDILKAERITSQTPATAENTMYPRFSTTDPLLTNHDISPKAKFREKYRSSGKDNSLIYGLVVLIVLLFIFIIVLQCVKKHKD